MNQVSKFIHYSYVLENQVINLTKETNNFHNKNYKILKKEIEKVTKKWKDIPYS